MSQVQYFTHDLTEKARTLLDASSRRTLRNKLEIEVKGFIENMAHNEYRALTNRNVRKNEILTLDTESAFFSQS